MNYPFYNPYQQPGTQPGIQGFQQFPQSYQNFQPQPTVQQQVPTIQGLSGRVVQSEQEVAPNEVPNDNTLGYYPSADGSVIWAKTWNSTGGITTQEYVLKQSTQETPKDPLEPILERLEAIETALNDLKPRPRTRKAADDE